MIFDELKKIRKYQEPITKTMFHKASYKDKEKDLFIGISNPELRKLAKEHYKTINDQDLKELLTHKFHEYRLLALIILSYRMKTKDLEKQKQIVDFYLNNLRYVDNWDLVDESAYKILGAYLYNINDYSMLYKMSKIDDLWKKRISIVATKTLIKNGVLNVTLDIVNNLMAETHHLLHKACGWMLREIGKKNIDILSHYIYEHYLEMPRTMLRYAIEKYPEHIRQAILKGDFFMDIEVKKLLKTFEEMSGKQVILRGWIRNIRSQKEFGFIDINDGTCFETIQVVFESGKIDNFKDVSKYRVGSSIEIKGTVELTPKMKQDFEIKASEINLIGDSLEDYPIQPKRHSREFLRENAHLRVRTNLFNAVFRVRSVIAFAIHKFFNENNFVYLHSPIITAADAEGAGEMFQVTTLDIENKIKEINYSDDFFGKKANLSVSGQLQAEAYALAFKKVYTFGPTFRAEKSNTPRHAAEFWMIEPEIAFADLSDAMNWSEKLIKYIINDVFEQCPSELDFFDRFVEKGLKSKLTKVMNSTFKVATHKDAVDILIQNKNGFENEPRHGEDLATEHEKFLTKYFDGPVFIIDWPKDIKAFYMRLNDDNETVAAVDLLVPGAGEIIGGSQREERLDILEKRIQDLDMDDKDLWWYKDLRKYGGCKHAGFGLGFERMIMYVTGIDNIRDVLPFPRTTKQCNF